MADPLPSTTISSAIHQIQLSLLNTAASPSHHLFAAAALLSCPDYEDVVTERSISNLCGYPLCPNPIPSDRPRMGRYRVSLREHRVYDLQETYKYCSEECVVNSRAFSASLTEERGSDVSESKVERVLGVFGWKGKGEGLGKDGDLGIKEDLVIKEKGGGGEVAVEEWIGPSNAIEGYVPQRDRGENSQSFFDGILFL